MKMSKKNEAIIELIAAAQQSIVACSHCSGTGAIFTVANKNVCGQLVKDDKYKPCARCSELRAAVQKVQDEKAAPGGGQ